MKTPRPLPHPSRTPSRVPSRDPSRAPSRVPSRASSHIRWPEPSSSPPLKSRPPSPSVSGSALGIAWSGARGSSPAFSSPLPLPGLGHYSPNQPPVQAHPQRPRPSPLLTWIPLPPPPHPVSLPLAFNQEARLCQRKLSNTHIWAHLTCHHPRWVKPNSQPSRRLLQACVQLTPPCFLLQGSLRPGRPDSSGDPYSSFKVSSSQSVLSMT